MVYTRDTEPNPRVDRVKRQDMLLLDGYKGGLLVGQNKKRTPKPSPVVLHGPPQGGRPLGRIHDWKGPVVHGIDVYNPQSCVPSTENQKWFARNKQKDSTHPPEVCPKCGVPIVKQFFAGHVMDCNAVGPKQVGQQQAVRKMSVPPGKQSFKALCRAASSNAAAAEAKRNRQAGDKFKKRG